MVSLPGVQSEVESFSFFIFANLINVSCYQSSKIKLVQHPNIELNGVRLWSFLPVARQSRRINKNMRQSEGLRMHFNRYLCGIPDKFEFFCIFLFPSSRGCQSVQCAQERLLGQPKPSYIKQRFYLILKKELSKIYGLLSRI